MAVLALEPGHAQECDVEHEIAAHLHHPWDGLIPKEPRQHGIADGKHHEDDHHRRDHRHEGVDDAEGRVQSVFGFVQASSLAEVSGLVPLAIFEIRSTKSETIPKKQMSAGFLFRISDSRFEF
jgi:hypothetical protein